VAIIFGLTLCGVVHLVDNIKKGDTIPQEFIVFEKKSPQAPPAILSMRLPTLSVKRRMPHNPVK
jgi:hypothetical protein